MILPDLPKSSDLFGHSCFCDMVDSPAAISMLIPWNTAAFLTAALKYFSANPWFFSVLQSWLCQWRCQKVFFMLLFIMKRTPYKRTCMAIKISLYICLNVNLDKEKTLKITFFLFFLSFGRPQISIKATVRLSKMQLSLWNYYSCILKLCQSIPFLVNKICVVVSFNNQCIPFRKTYF